MMVRTYPGCSRRIRARMVTPISSLISSGGLSICCATAEPSKPVTSSSLDRNGISSSSRLVASAFCKASVNLAERTRAALNSFAKPVLSVRNVRWRRHFSTAASISRRNDGAFLQRVAAAVTSQVQSLSYYIDLLHNGCSGDGTDLQGPRHGLPRNGRASGADLRTTWCTHRCR
jgi:hypothetical protein